MLDLCLTSDPDVSVVALSKKTNEVVGLLLCDCQTAIPGQVLDSQSQYCTTYVLLERWRWFATSQVCSSFLRVECARRT